jgi:hypothetical protein
MNVSMSFGEIIAFADRRPMRKQIGQTLPYGFFTDIKQNTDCRLEKGLSDSQACHLFAHCQFLRASDCLTDLNLS